MDLGRSLVRCARFFGNLIVLSRLRLIRVSSTPPGDSSYGRFFKRPILFLIESICKIWSQVGRMDGST